jgi:hypothetical protein
MMTLEETTKLYEMVLRQLLPVGGYDRAPNTIFLMIFMHMQSTCSM